MGGLGERIVENGVLHQIHRHRILDLGELRVLDLGILRKALILRSQARAIVDLGLTDIRRWRTARIAEGLVHPLPP